MHEKDFSAELAAGENDTGPSTTETASPAERVSDRILRDLPEQVHRARANGLVNAVRDATAIDNSMESVVIETLNYFARCVFATIGSERFKDCTPDDMLRFVGVCAKRTAMRIGTGNPASEGTSGSLRSEAP